MNNSQIKRSVLSFIAVLIAIFLLAVVDIYGADLVAFQIPGYKDGIRLGLDLVGGSSITFEAVIDPADNMSGPDIESGMDSAEAMIRSRLDSFGYTEALLSRAGNNRLLVEIPNVSNPEEAVELLGSTASLEFRDADGSVIIKGGQIKSAKSAVGPVEANGPSVPHVVLVLSDDAREAFREATRQAAARDNPEERYIAIYLDETERSHPFVDAKYASTGIDSADVSITVGSGANAAKEAKDLAALISIGQLPFALKQVELRGVGSQLGEEALRTSLMAGFIGLGMVILFMLVYYRLPGLMADLALGAYVVLMVLILSLLRVNLSLPGIAGIILSIGMAVDANVIIFERIKDELRLGKTVRAAIDSGFKRALSAIIDGNVTTVISCVVLLALGTGPIKGFAITLLIGVILSMITVLVISRFLLVQMSNMNVANPWLYGVKGGETA